MAFELSLRLFVVGPITISHLWFYLYSERFGNTGKCQSMTLLNKCGTVNTEQVVEIIHQSNEVRSALRLPAMTNIVSTKF